jgi:hypothetical protein
MTIRPSKEKDASPSARVFAAIKFAFGLFLQVDPATQFLPIYDDDDEVESNSMVPISASSTFPGGLLELSNHAQVSNSWGLAPVWGSDKDGKPKKQPSVFVHIKLHTKFEREWLFGHIMGRLGDEGILLKVKPFPYLDTKTRIAIVGTSNSFCPVALLDRLHDGLAKHEEWIQANEKKNLQYADQPFPPFLIRKSNVKMPNMTDITSEDATFVEYFQSLRNGPVFEVAEADWPRFKVVTDSAESRGMVKEWVSKDAHFLELLYGNNSNPSKIEFFKTIKAHMNYNHAYRQLDIKGVKFLDYTFRVEKKDKAEKPPYKKSTLRRELLNLERKDGEKNHSGSSISAPG